MHVHCNMHTQHATSAGLVQNPRTDSLKTVDFRKKIAFSPRFNDEVTRLFVFLVREIRRVCVRDDDQHNSTCAVLQKLGGASHKATAHRNLISLGTPHKQTSTCNTRFMWGVSM
jgi:hypothetical protein